ncbi:MAG: hypothetical protein ACFE9Z_00020 [Promethearchaeota archaeon]
MKGKRWRYSAFIFSIFGSIQFIVITIIAMIFYTGGTYLDPSTTHYIFWYNYFSDLGRVISHSGLSNQISFILFSITLSLWGISQTVFYIAFPFFFKNNQTPRLLSIIASFFGIFSGVFFVGIAFTPTDIVQLLHDFFVFLGFASVFFSICFYSITLFIERSYPNSYAFVLIIASTILGIYYIILFVIPNTGTLIELFIYVIGQKIIIYVLLTAGIIQGFGALKQINS